MYLVTLMFLVAFAGFSQQKPVIEEGLCHKYAVLAGYRNLRESCSTGFVPFSF
jgi:hypothetical protein